MLAQATVSCRPSATTTSALRSLTTRHSNSTSRISTTRSAPTRPSAINKPLRFRASPRSRPPSPRRRSELSSSEPRRRRCRWTSRTGRRSWETSTEIITGTGTTPTTTNSTATKRARTEGGSRRTSFWRSRWRGRGSLRSRCTKALGELWKEEISVGSEMQFGKKLGSKIKILLHNKKLIIECWKSRNIKYGGIFFRIFFIPTVVLVYSFFFFFFFTRLRERNILVHVIFLTSEICIRICGEVAFHFPRLWVFLPFSFVLFFFGDFIVKYWKYRNCSGFREKSWGANYAIKKLKVGPVGSMIGGVWVIIIF